MGNENASSSLEHLLALARAGEEGARWDRICAGATAVDKDGIDELNAALADWSDAARPAPTAWRTLPPALRIARVMRIWGIDLPGAVLMAESPYLSRLTDLTIGGAIGGQGVQALAASPYLAQLHRLALIGSGMGAEGATALATSPHLATLSSLALTGAHLGTDGVRALTCSGQFAPLRELALEDTIGAQGAAGLAESPLVASCEVLSLANSEIGDDGARSLAASLHLTQLVELNLRGAGIGEEGVCALAKSAGLRTVQRLNLAFAEGLGARASEALMSSNAPWRLRTLCLAYTYVEPDALEALALSPGMAAVAELDLRGNMFEADAIGPLVASQSLGALMRLDLADNEILAEGAAALAGAATPSLRALGLEGNYIGDRGAAVLAAAPSFAGLRELNLKGNGIGDAGMVALAAAGLGEFDMLNLSSNPIGVDGFKAFCDAAGPGPSELYLENVLPAAKSLLQAWEAAAPHRAIHWGEQTD